MKKKVKKELYVDRGVPKKKLLISDGKSAKGKINSLKGEELSAFKKLRRGEDD